MTKYPSRYSDNKKVTAAQYLAEFMCERQAEKNKKELPKRFWNLPHWAKKFKSQLFAAHGLLKLYSEVAIIRAVKSKEARNTYSLRAPTLDDIVKEQQHILVLDEAKAKDTSAVIRKDTRVKPREHQIKNTIFGKLNELDE